MTALVQVQLVPSSALREVLENHTEFQSIEVSLHNFLRNFVKLLNNNGQQAGEFDFHALYSINYFHSEVMKLVFGFQPETLTEIQKHQTLVFLNFTHDNEITDSFVLDNATIAENTIKIQFPVLHRTKYDDSTYAIVTEYYRWIAFLKYYADIPTKLLSSPHFSFQNTVPLLSPSIVKKGFLMLKSLFEGFEMDHTLKDLESKLERYYSTKTFLSSPSRGALLWGPPGTGKSFLSLKIVQLLGFHLIWKGSGSQLQKQYVGQAAEELKTLSKYCAANPYWLHALIIDEIDSAFSMGNQSSQESHAAQLAGALQVTIGDENPNLFTLATTNYKNNIPEPLIRKGRIGYHYFVGPLSLESRKKLINSLISKYNCTHQGGSISDWLAAKTLNYGGAFLISLIGDFEHSTITEALATQQLISYAQQYRHSGLKFNYYLGKSLDYSQQLMQQVAPHSNSLSGVVFVNMKSSTMELQKVDLSSVVTSIENGNLTNALFTLAFMHGLTCVRWVNLDDFILRSKNGNAADFLKYVEEGAVSECSEMKASGKGAMIVVELDAVCRVYEELVVQNQGNSGYSFQSGSNSSVQSGLSKSESLSTKYLDITPLYYFAEVFRRASTKFFTVALVQNEKVLQDLKSLVLKEQASATTTEKWKQQEQVQAAAQLTHSKSIYQQRMREVTMSNPYHQ